MLYVYMFEEEEYPKDVVPAGLDIITNVDAAFCKADFVVDSTTSRIVQFVDEGELLDRRTFRDRFGVTLYTDFLSTGSKAGLLVHSTDRVVDLTECGTNAKSAILSFCKNGAIVLPRPFICYENYAMNEPHEYWFQGKTFTDMIKLWRCMIGAD